MIFALGLLVLTLGGTIGVPLGIWLAQGRPTAGE